MGYAFISYSTKNQSSADSMRELLNKNGIKTWMAPNDIPIGSRYAQVINQAVRECSCFVLLLTDYAQKSVWVSKEVERAISYGRTIIPIQLEQIKLNDEFELYISSNQMVAIQKIDESDPVMSRIIATVSHHCCKDGATPTATSAPKKQAAPKPKAPTTVAEKLRQTIKASAPASIQNEDAEATANNLKRAFESFGISVSIDGYDIGPRLIRYRITPDAGVSATKISRLKDDLALAVGTSSIRIVIPIPGTHHIGIELPRSAPECLKLLDVIKSDEISKNTTTVAMGCSVDGKNIFKDAKDFPHLLVGGATGTGKSVFINSLLISILSHATPDDVRFILIDTRGVELFQYKPLPHLLCPIINDAGSAIRALEYAVSEMNRRYDCFMNASVRNIDAYNVAVTPDKRLPRIFIVVDELSDLMLADKGSIELRIMTISQKARAAGIHLIIGTQRPTPDVLTGTVKANMPSRVAFKTSTAIDSRNIIDESGAEWLLNNGDMLYRDLTGKVQRLQAFYITDNELKSFIDTLNTVYEDTVYDNDAVNEIMGEVSKDENESDSYTTEILCDERFRKSVEACIKHGAVSVSFLQRTMCIGYSKAARYINEMLNLGIAEESASGTRGRKIRIVETRWRELLNNCKI